MKQDAQSMRDWYRNELELCLLIADRSPRNYYCWQYIYWVHQQLYINATQQYVSDQTIREFKHMATLWFIRILEWTGRHPKECAAFHYLRQWIPLYHRQKSPHGPAKIPLSNDDDDARIQMALKKHQQDVAFWLKLEPHTFTAESVLGRYAPWLHQHLTVHEK